MSDDYTPTTEQVRDDYAHQQVPEAPEALHVDFERGRAEFRRWLVAYEQEVTARALRRARDSLRIVSTAFALPCERDTATVRFVFRWLTARADAIEKGVTDV